MAFRIRYIFVILCIITIKSCILFADDDFENLNWEPLYPYDILEDSVSKIKISTGFFVDNFDSINNKSLPGGVFFSIKPEMHFLVFDGKFNVLFKSFSNENDFFFDIANDEVSDYFESVALNYRDLKFVFGERAVLEGVLTYLPSTDYDKRYLGFDFDFSDWYFTTRSLNWKSWALQLDTPSFGMDNFRVSLQTDCFFDNSASLTAAVTAGPKLNIFDYYITPFAGYGYQERFSESDNQKLINIFGENEIKDDFYTFGIKTGYENDLFKIKTGFFFSRIMEYYTNICLSPLSINFGKRFNLARNEEDIINWVKVSWDLSTEYLNTKIGFGIDDSLLNGKKQFLFLDLNAVLNNDLGLNFSLSYGDKTEFYIGIDYSFGLKDFYKEE